MFAAIARAGIATRGFVYLIIGVLAFMYAWGTGERASGSIGVLTYLMVHPLGRLMVVLIAVGLACHTIWRLGQAFADTDREGKGLVGVLLRFASGVLAIIYGGLTFTAVQLALVEKSTVRDNQSEQTIAKIALSLHFGQTVLGLVSLGFFIAGIVNLIDVYRAGFKQYLRISELHKSRRNLILNLGRAGAFTHAILCFFVAAFFFIAARDERAREARGLAGVMSFILHMRSGVLLLSVFSAGLMTYAVFELFQARYRRVTP